MQATMAALQTGWSYPMSIKSKIAAFALVALTGLPAPWHRPSRLRPKRAGHRLRYRGRCSRRRSRGSAIAANNGYYGYGYRCGWVRHDDGYGNYVGRVRTCNY